jgi:carbonic anhydrase
MDLKSIFHRNKIWAEKKISDKPDYFIDLARGQQPKILYIGCSDSRVSAEEIMGVEPGEVFVYRNIANQVPNSDLASMAVINYAVTVLEVEHIVVCGHYRCGGVEAALQPKDMGILNPWLRNIRDVYRLHRPEIEKCNSSAEKNKRLVELNVLEQCVNVLKSYEVQKAIRQNKISVHGWVFDLESGLLKDLNIDVNHILENIMTIYRIE